MGSLLRRVRGFLRKYFDAIRAHDQRGDPSHRWRIPSVGKTGVLMAMLSLPDKSNELRPMKQKCVRQMGEGLRRKHGDETFQFYNELMNLSDGDCAYARMSSMRVSRLIPGGEIHSASLAEKVRFQELQPGLPAQNRGWKEGESVEKLKQLARAFKVLALRGLEWRVPWNT